MIPLVLFLMPPGVCFQVDTLTCYGVICSSRDLVTLGFEVRFVL
jgi:hypothetical protein